MNNHRLAVGLLGVVALFVSACGGTGSGGGGGATMDLQQVSNGFGQMLPHTILQIDSSTGLPTQTVIPIRTSSDLLNNVKPTNGVRPVPQFPTTASLPSGSADPGNHFFFVEFTQPIDISSVLDPSPGSQALGGLTGAITLVALDPTTGATEIVPSRVFVNGYTYAGTVLPGPPPTLPLQQWVKFDEKLGRVVAVRPEAVGFPGTESDFSGASKLVLPTVITFVADSDGDLATHDTFPAGKQLRMRISTAVRSTAGRNLAHPALASTTVGADTFKPEVSTTPPPISTPLIVPGSGDTNVDPLTTIQITFTEPVQPHSVGSLPNGQIPSESASIAIAFGPSSARVQVPFTAMPPSVFDLSTYTLTPSFNFPGEGPDEFSCGVFNRIDVSVNAGQLSDLATVPNINLLSATTNFTTGEGAGLVNAPVTPDTIYVGRQGAIPGISVLDLNGFGQSTGIPTFDPTYQTFGNDPLERTNFPNNPNVKLQGSILRPSLAPGTCTLDGGSSGAFTLTRDSSLNDLLIRAPVLTSIGDMMLGHGIDATFNDGPPPFGCQFGHGNLCASNGKKLIAPVAVGTGNTMAPAQTNQFGNIAAGSENLMGWAPHPNPPPLIFPPLCISPYIGGQEPTSIDSTLAPPVGPGLTNLLVPGDALGHPLQGIPPSGLLTPEQNAFFEGPSIEQQTIAACQTYQIRQQIGTFLYLIDRARREIVVLNSNRMTVIDRIQMFDPTALAMSPNLNFLAVVNQLSNLVSFLDIDPSSGTFHQVVAETVVGIRPRGAAWDPGNEDVLVANEGDSSVSILSASSLQVRKTIRSQLELPFDIAMTPRQPCWGFSRNVYFAYIMNRNGRLAIMESGPNTVNGWGYDDVIGISTETFRSPKAIQTDPLDLRSAVWIAHEGPINLTNGQPGPYGVGAMSKFVATSGLTGQLPLNFTSLFIPQLRDLAYSVQVSIGTDHLSGVPTDMAFDDLRVLSGMPNFTTVFSAGPPAQINGKQIVRGGCPLAVVNTNESKYMFVAVPNSLNGTGVIDVIVLDGTFGRVDTNAYFSGIQSIPAPDVQVLMDFFRQ